MAEQVNPATLTAPGAGATDPGREQIDGLSLSGRTELSRIANAMERNATATEQIFLIMLIMVLLSFTALVVIAVVLSKALA